MKSHIKYLLSIILGMLSGILITVLLYRDHGFTAKDMIEAQTLGENRALDISKPSERLEAVCAALWMKTNTSPDQ